MTFSPDFDESKVNRDSDGKFGEKTGTAPELDHFLLVGGDTSTIAKLDATVRGREISFERPDGTRIEFDTGDDVAGNAVAVQLADGTTEVRWAKYDDSPGEYNFTEGDSIQEFRSEAARDAFIAEQIADGVPKNHIFIVQKYSHGSDSFSLYEGRLNDQWDSAPSNVLVLDAKNEHGIEEANLREAAVITLADYTSWANGETYAVNSAIVGVNGEETGDRDTVYGYTGSKYAQETIEAGDF